jgi:hypothetical protein
MSNMNLDLLCNVFLNQPGDDLELEARFGTIPFFRVGEAAARKQAFRGKPEDKKNFEGFVRGNRFFNTIRKNNFDNVVRVLKTMGFELRTTQEMLKISAPFTEKGDQRESSIRTVIHGAKGVQDYCKTNAIHTVDEVDGQRKLKPYLIFNNKRQLRATDLEGIPGVDPMLYTAPGRDGQQRVNASYDVPELNFRVSLSHDRMYGTMDVERDAAFREFTSNWENKKKTFRMMKRHVFSSRAFPGFEVHLTSVRSSHATPSGKPISEYTVKESQVLTQPETYEVEIEGVHGAADLAGFVKGFRGVIRLVLCGLQNTQYPLSYFEMFGALDGYSKLVAGAPLDRRLTSARFVGPGSISLEMHNMKPTQRVTQRFERVVDKNGEERDVVREEREDDYSQTILEHYTVTDKADGERRLLYVDGKGKMYLIDSNMGVYYTGLVTKQAAVFNSLADGEYIARGKAGELIHLYAMFDIYFLGGVDQRAKPFTRTRADPEPADGKPVDNTQYRLFQLSQFAGALMPQAAVRTSQVLEVRMKTFEYGSVDEEKSIFDAARNVLEAARDYKYETDGLIFTPARLGVGMEAVGDSVKNRKHTWMRSFKWKPPKYNTVDFLVTTQKDARKRDVVHTVYQPGAAGLKEYKTLILRVGYDTARHGFENPYQMVLDGNVGGGKRVDRDRESDYKPVPFVPEKYGDAKDPMSAHTCNLFVRQTASDSGKVMFADDGEAIEDDTIVEFAYDPAREPGWRWKPLRVRFDKTAERRAGAKNFGNAYHVANSVWNSIHNPITRRMITTGEDIPDATSISDAYYNRDSGNSKTRSLRNFHNLYVKSKLMLSVAKARGVHTLMDVAVGKAGDMSKWISANIKFVLGVDVSKDNIENRVDGACARYIRSRRANPSTPDALFLNGDSGLHIRSGDAFPSAQARDIAAALFTEKGRAPDRSLPAGVRPHRGKLAGGADVVSCQFALHYFFRDRTTLHTFLRNVSEGCRVGGFFIGTCYDGQRVFNMLRDVKPGEGVEETIDGKRIWEVKRMFTADRFEPNSSSVGYAIDVYQETINKVFREYLVNFDYLRRLMRNYGFELLTPTEAKRMGLPNASGLFDELYQAMTNQIKYETEKYTKSNLETVVREAVNLSSSPAQQKVSFLNRYFVFKKVNNVNAKAVFRSLADGPDADESAAMRRLKAATQKGAKAPKAAKRKVTIRKKAPAPEPAAEDKPAPKQTKKPEKKEAKKAAPAPAPAPAPAKKPEKKEAKKADKPAKTAPEPEKAEKKEAKKAKKAEKKKCPPGKVINPDSQRCVKKENLEKLMAKAKAAREKKAAKAK